MEGLEFRKTALDDDAYIYQNHPKQTEKEKWQEMDWKQRKEYFVEYYLVKCIAVILLSVTVIFLIAHFAGPKEENVLYVAVIDESLDSEKLEQMENDLNELLDADGSRRKVIIDDTFFTRKDALTRLEVYLHSSQIDVIIANRETWEQYAAYGFFQNMDDVLGNHEKKLYEDKYLMTAGYQDSEEITFEDQETGKGEEKPYGIDISDSARFSGMKEYMEQPVLAVAEGSANRENAVLFLNYLMQEGE
ncbi:MAG: hypothetical protein SOW08_11800 [Lachnospiraceae bacterium]|nr:hypothetical protein [Lachnospiraceae bacterium]